MYKMNSFNVLLSYSPFFSLFRILIPQWAAIIYRDMQKDHTHAHILYFLKKIKLLNRKDRSVYRCHTHKLNDIFRVTVGQSLVIEKGIRSQKINFCIIKQEEMKRSGRPFLIIQHFSYSTQIIRTYFENFSLFFKFKSFIFWHF